MNRSYLFLLCFVITQTIAQNNGVTSLKSKASFPIGSSIRFVPFMKDIKLKGLQQHHFDSYTAGSDMKMYQIAPKPCLLYTSPSPRDRTRSRMPSSA